MNYAEAYNVDDGSCILVGCTDESSALYDAAATFGLPCMCEAKGCFGRRARALQEGGCCPIPSAYNYALVCSDPCLSPDFSFGCCDFEVSIAMRRCHALR